jgi:ammonium transporter Rh
LTSSVIATYVTSIFLRGKFGIDEILNGTLSGGVIIGSSCNLITNPVGAIAIGLFGGALTTFGFIKLSGWLTKVGIYDVCGVHNLHGLPGFFGGIFGAIFLGAYSTSGTSNILGPVGWISDNYLVRGGYQMAGVAVSLGIAIVSGIIVGFILWLAFKM